MWPMKNFEVHSTGAISFYVGYGGRIVLSEVQHDLGPRTWLAECPGLLRFALGKTPERALVNFVENASLPAEKKPSLQQVLLALYDEASRSRN